MWNSRDIEVTPGARCSGGQISASSTLEDSGRLMGLQSRLDRAHHVAMTRNAFAPDNALVRNCLAGRDALVVMSPSVHRLYGPRIRAYFEEVTDVHFMVLHRTEASKSLDAVVEVTERAAAVGLRRTSPIVAIGGGVCTDISGLAAALHRRGVPHFNVPTTLVGLVDAGIGTKNAVNHGRRKSALGTFYPPEHTVLDIDFLATLPRRQLANGLAEIIKLAVVKDRPLFELLDRYGMRLLDCGFRRPVRAADEIVWRAAAGMLAELARNQFEIGDFRRKVDFGHTFSPYIEVASGHSVLHGEAVAMDIALSAQLAHALGLLTEADLERILTMLETTGLALVWPGLSVDALCATLPSIVEHRNGDLHLVVPTGIGTCEFLGAADINPALLRASMAELVRRTCRDDIQTVQRRTLAASGGQ
ncbi:sedoheptulose 7-phosphate cyclase [Kibdelosporangium persicum]|uniref:2-epi-5-epi-valiolone synthase n=1 Tax=Kibdelosporangium persicum TaxID=2698649 RepID=A0ABX2FET6_9PSEU|nr:sedoheptulose 7-phosphate cyclase [Kibdelosporangium persicum]NRN69395.1 Iron-containing alcohol dehydrogenase [Kibdelosporangium persicum]